MLRTSVHSVLGLALAAGISAPTAGAQSASAVTVGTQTRGTDVVGFSISAADDEAGLTFRLSDGSTLRILLKDGTVRVNGDRVGRYDVDGALSTAWRELVDQAAILSSDEAVAIANGWSPDGTLTEEEAATAQSLTSLLAGLRVGAASAFDSSESLWVSADAIREAARGARVSADAIREAIEARVSADAIRGAIEARVADQVGRDVRDRVRSEVRVGRDDVQWVSNASPVETLWNSALGLLGAFLALTGVAFGASFFAERQLDVVADTVSTSLGRSFFVGLFAQPLILPVFGMMLVGLTLTVVGILVIPFAIVAFFVALAAALIGGYLAVARVAGASWLRRKGQDYGTEGAAMLKSIAYGLGLVLLPWVPAVALGSVPVAGPVLLWTAIAVTWALATTGFGAAILTRGGVRGTFGRRFAPPPITPDELFAQDEDRISTSEWFAGRAVR
ncbi:MAG TPA: hypothetical protein VGA37_00285 [Gemmatimonadales bacterium]